MKTLSFLITINLTLLSFTASSQESAEKRSEIGLFYSTGTTTHWGKSASQYSKNKFNGFFDFGTFYLWKFPNYKYSFKTEYSAKFVNSDYLFPGGELGLASQAVQGFNFKFGRNFGLSNANSLDYFLGPGIYTVYQERIPGLEYQNVPKLKDGHFAYWGMSVEFEIAASMPFGSGRMGVGTRIFFQPPFTIASKANVPNFFHNGFSISWFVSR
jgi:hypothetical protein